MTKILTITFHHAHNFGSALQTYALGEYVKSLYEEKGESAEYGIIDLYTPFQEELYSVLKHGKSVTSIVKNIIALPYKNMLDKKHEKFEKFLADRFTLTKRYKTVEELKNEVPKADMYISGSDQIWNVRARDFLSAYYFDFLPDDAKRISYSASLGPLKIDWSKYDGEKIKTLLSKYSAISVREKGSADSLKALTDIGLSVNVDPTMLLKADEWRKIQSNANYKDGKYILLYCLEPSKTQLEMADAISKKLKLPVVILRYNNKNDMFNHFVKKYDSGPEDFLSYIDNAALVLSSSFHGTAFSLIYHKPFYIFNGKGDNRISSILKKTDMLERSLENIEDVDRVTLDKPNEDAIEALLDEERESSREYLRRALDI